MPNRLHAVTGDADVADLAAAVRRLADDRGRVLLGLCGAPGAGKSELAAALRSSLGDQARCVPMDGFHLADVELRRQGLLDRKGAPETFDVWGFRAALGRLRDVDGTTVYAPGFARDLEQPIAGAIAIPPQASVVITEGNYLLLDRPGWREVRDLLDEIWYLVTDEEQRMARLVARHEDFGKSPGAARAWVATVDEPNAALVEASAARADRRVDLSAWRLTAE